MKKVNYYIYIFLSASILGWVLEILYSLIFRDKFIIPGNISPFCPIYGVGLIAIMILVFDKRNKILSFFQIFLIATLIEYFSAYISEIYFNHRIWNYSNYLFNIDGRVCLIFSLIWGIFGFMYIYLLEPKIKRIYDKYNSEKTDLFLYLILALFFISLLGNSIIKYHYLLINH